MTNVWAVIHHVHRVGGDVAVASNRGDDPAEWEQAHYGALRNMRNAQAEAERWTAIADEMADGLAMARSTQTDAIVARLEGEGEGQDS